MAHEQRQEEGAATQWMAAVLVVEDNALARSALARLLRDWGWTVATTDSGAAAFGLLRAGLYGCVVSDHRMPGGDGLDLVKRWAAIRDPATPVLVQTGDRDAGLVATYRDLGVRVLAKPADLHALRDWVTAALAGRL